MEKGIDSQRRPGDCEGRRGAPLVLSQPRVCWSILGTLLSSARAMTVSSGSPKTVVDIVLCGCAFYTSLGSTVIDSNEDRRDRHEDFTHKSCPCPKQAIRENSPSLLSSLLYLPVKIWNKASQPYDALHPPIIRLNLRGDEGGGPSDAGGRTCKSR